MAENKINRHGNTTISKNNKTIQRNALERDLYNLSKSNNKIEDEIIDFCDNPLAIMITFVDMYNIKPTLVINFFTTTLYRCLGKIFIIIIVFMLIIIFHWRLFVSWNFFIIVRILERINSFGRQIGSSVYFSCCPSFLLLCFCYGIRFAAFANIQSRSLAASQIPRPFHKIGICWNTRLDFIWKMSCSENSIQIPLPDDQFKISWIFVIFIPLYVNGHTFHTNSR